MCYSNAAPEYFFNLIGGIKMEVGIGQHVDATKAKKIMLASQVAATSFAGMRKNKMQKGFGNF